MENSSQLPWIIEHYENNPLTIIPGCFAIIRNLKGEILVVLEGDTRPRKRSGQIWLPWGKIEGDESPIEGIMREVKEEVNIDIPYSVLDKKWTVPDFHMFDYSNIIPIRVFNVKLLQDIKDLRTNMHQEILKVFFMSEADIMSQPLNNIRPWVIEAIHVSEGKKIDTPVLIKDWYYQKNPLPIEL